VNRGEAAARAGHCPKIRMRSGSSTVFPPATLSTVKPQTTSTPPDFALMREHFRQHRHLTLQLLREANPGCYRYSRFRELYQRWRSKIDAVLHQEHDAGEKMFVD